MEMNYKSHNENINILVVDDHPLVRRGIIDILSLNNSWKDIIEASNIENAFKVISAQQVDIIIVDLHLGIENGFDLIEKVKKLYQNIKFIILTSSSSVMDFKRAQLLNVEGYILKDAFIDDIIYALNVVVRGQNYYSPQLLCNSMNESKEMMSLTIREKEVLFQLSRGMTNSQISNALYIAEGTTKKHISNILSKLDMNNRIEAVLYARNIYGYE
jgi:two-component system nitrate/nitrite response regulator NarL